MKKKLLCMGLAVMMVFSLIACGEKKEDGGNKETQGTQGKQEESDKASDQKEGNSADSIVTPAGEFPIVKEDVTITLGVVNNGNVVDFKTNYFTNWLKEKTGVSMEFQEIPSAEVAEKVQLAFASDDFPDAYCGIGRANGTVFSTTNIIKYGTESSEQVVPLNDYIETYGTEIKALFEQYESDGLREMMTSADGNIYYMPGFGPSYINRSPNKIWLNQSWLDKLNLEVPETTEEFQKVLEAFATQDPNGNGKADEIPFVGTSENASYSGYDGIISAFCTNNTQYHRLINNNGTVEFAPVSDEWRQAMCYMNDLCSAGLFSPLTFTQDTTSLKQILNDENDICGAVTTLGIGLLGVTAGSEALERYRAIPPLAGPDGYRTSVLTIPTPSAGGVITSACKHPEVVFRLFDFMLSFEASTISRYGEEGVNWEKPEEGTPNFYGGNATIRVLDNCFSVSSNQMWQNFNPFVNNVHNDGQEWDGTLNGEYLNSLGAIESMKYEPTDTIPILIFDTTEVDEANETMIYLDDYVKETIAKFITGEYDPYSDADWEKYLKEYNALGLESFLKLAQAAYDRMNQ